MPRTLRWTVVIPVKSLPAAKSRLAPMTADAAAHRRLVEAIRSDTIAAARRADGVARVLLVTDTLSPAEVPDAAADHLQLAQVQPGLNGALGDGADYAATQWPGDGIAVLVGDLPALQPDELAAALAAASAAGGGFVADADGTGTTLLASVPGDILAPRFGAGSAARHGAFAVSLPAGPGLRRDVDTAADLDAAASEVGVGPATARVLADLAITTDSPDRTGATRSPSVGMIWS